MNSVLRSLGVLAAAVLLVTAAGCTSSTDSDPVARLAVELPDELWDAIQSEFTYDEGITERLAEMNADLFAGYPDELDVEWWGFLHEGSVAEAYAALPVPEDSTPTEPYEASIGDLLAEFLELWEVELAEVRDASWHEDVAINSAEWSERTQTVAEFGVATGTHAEEQGWSTVFETAGGDPELALSTWVFSLVSPIVDLERLEIVEGTYLIVRVVDAEY